MKTNTKKIKYNSFYDAKEKDQPSIILAKEKVDKKVMDKLLKKFKIKAI